MSLLNLQNCNFSFFVFHHHPLSPPAATLIIELACPKCGIIGKSGKLSCCGRGGSWFGNCGSAGEAKLDHKWSEGVEACKAWSQPEIVVGQQLHGAQDESDGTIRVNSEGVIMAPNRFISTTDNVSVSRLDINSASTINTPMSMTSPADTANSKETTTASATYTNISTTTPSVLSVNWSITAPANTSIDTVAGTLTTGSSNDLGMTVPDPRPASAVNGMRRYVRLWDVTFHLTIFVFNVCIS